jgi:hypothetical protein
MCLVGKVGITEFKTVPAQVGLSVQINFSLSEMKILIQTSVSYIFSYLLKNFQLLHIFFYLV